MSRHDPEPHRTPAKQLVRAKTGTEVHRTEPSGDHRANLPARYRRTPWHPLRPGTSEHAKFVADLVGSWPAPPEGFLARPEVARVLSSLRASVLELRSVS